MIKYNLIFFNQRRRAIFTSKSFVPNRELKNVKVNKSNRISKFKEWLKYKEKMIARFINGFVSILIGVSLIGPISDQVNTAAATNGSLYNASTWGATVLQIVPGFFAIAILAIGIAVLYGNLRDAGMA